MSSFQGVTLIPLTYTPLNTPGSVRRSSEEFPADITVIYATETNMPNTIVPAAGYLSPNYVPSSRTNSSDPLPFRSSDADVPMAPYRSPSASTAVLMPVPSVDPVSPTSAANIIQGFDIDDLARLHHLTEQLIQTIRQRDRIHHQEQEEYAETIADLHQRLERFQKEAWKEIPPGYEENKCFPGLTISNSNGVHRPVKWIKLLDNCTVSGFTEGDGPGSTPHIFHIYAQPTARGQLVEALPAWFEERVIGPMPLYQELYEAACDLNDWGIAADIARLRDFDTLEQEASAEIRKWEARLASYGQSRRTCKNRLEGARALYRLSNFQNLGPIREQGQFARQGRVSPTARGRANVARG